MASGSDSFLVWALITGGAFVVYVVVVLAAMLLRAFENKMDALETIVTSAVEAEDIPIEAIDEVAGVAGEARLFRVHHHLEDTPCEDWVLSVAGGVMPSTVMRPYPTLRKGDHVVFSPVTIDRDNPLVVRLDSRIHDIFDTDDFPFESLALVFAGPSKRESFAMKVSTLVFHLADVYRTQSVGREMASLAGNETPDRVGEFGDGLEAALNARLGDVTDLEVQVREVVLVSHP